MKSKIVHIFGLVFILLLGGCVTIYNPATGQKEYYFINEKTEIMLGRNIAQDIIRTNKAYNDEKALSMVQNMGEKIGKSSHRNKLKYHFYILDEDTMNAFALPGGYIFVNKGLIDKITKDELAFVLAHEIGHITARHSLKRLQASLGMSLLFDIALGRAGDADVRQVVNIAYGVIASGYSRKDELLADSLAVRYSYAAGHNPGAAISLFNKMKEESREGYTPIFLRSHPIIADRIANVKEKIMVLDQP